MKRFLTGLITMVAGIVLFPLVAHTLNIIEKTPNCENDGESADFIGEVTGVFWRHYFYQCPKCGKVIKV